jgi:hypothetical protein
MMKKIIYIGLVAILLMTGFSALSTANQMETTNNEYDFKFKYIKGWIEFTTVDTYSIADDLSSSRKLYEDIHFEGEAHGIYVGSAYKMLRFMQFLPNLHDVPDFTEVQIDMDFFFGKIVDYGPGATGHVYYLEGLGRTITLTEC